MHPKKYFDIGQQQSDYGNRLRISAGTVKIYYHIEEERHFIPGKLYIYDGCKTIGGKNPI